MKNGYYNIFGELVETPQYKIDPELFKTWLKCTAPNESVRGILEHWDDETWITQFNIYLKGIDDAP